MNLKKPDLTKDLSFRKSDGDNQGDNEKSSVTMHEKEVKELDVMGKKLKDNSRKIDEI